jgi:electron transfer flavoprotein-quinone oxidoreductase
MDLAAASGELAARAVIAAKESGDFSAASLRRYEELLKESFVMKDMEFYGGAPDFLENSSLYRDAPRQLGKMLAEIFTVDGNTPRHLKEKLADAGLTAAELMKGAGVL